MLKILPGNELPHIAGTDDEEPLHARPVLGRDEHLTKHNSSLKFQGYHPKKEERCCDEVDAQRYGAAAGRQIVDDHDYSGN